MVIAGRLITAHNPSGNGIPWYYASNRKNLCAHQIEMHYQLTILSEKNVYFQSRPRLVKEKISWLWQCTGKQHKRPNVRGVNLIICHQTAKYVRLKQKSDFYLQNWNCSRMNILRNTKSSPMSIIIKVNIFQNSWYEIGLCKTYRESK